MRAQIIKLVKDYYREQQRPFVLGKDLIKCAGLVYDEKEMVNLIEASLDFWLVGGKRVNIFEKKLADFIGMHYAIMTNSGSSANLLAVCALTSPLLKDRRLKPGDEVIATACGFPTTVNPIIQNNLIPVFVDVELGTYDIQADQVEQAIGPKTRAIFVAHTLGNPSDLETLTGIARKHNLWIIEDNCDSMGSRYQGRNTGSFGDISTCSFYPAHHISTGEGGAVLTNDPVLRKIILSFRDWGRDCWCQPGSDDTCHRRHTQHFPPLPSGYDHKYVYSHIGYNLKSTDLQAAIGLAQIEKLPKFIKVRKRNFDYLYEKLRKYADIFDLPRSVCGAEPCWFGFPLMHDKRNDIVNWLENHKIATRMLFGGNLLMQPAYQDIAYRKIGSLKNTDQVMNHLFWIGIYPGITLEHLDYITKVIGQYRENSQSGRKKRNSRSKQTQRGIF